MNEWVARLAERGEDPALVDGETGATTTYGELSVRVDSAAESFAGERRLVMCIAAPTVDFVATYLGALVARQVVLVSSPDAADQLAGAWQPDVVLAADGTLQFDEHGEQSPPRELHDDLALLLPTSGSTGAPKLVRLSATNVLANAAAIADYLDLEPTDRALGTLPMHYCYGLSVLHSHLLAGASVVLTDIDVSTDRFVDMATTHRVTSFAGVPHTFDILKARGFDGGGIETLRYVTQAGGRMSPDDVRHWADAGRNHGWDLVVMYGQTEATARMAYLPPALAADHPDSVGRAVAGGRFQLEPTDAHPDPAVGELVFSGPNVMLGYAHEPADLARGREIESLRTGDLATIDPDGLVRIVGRSARFAKVMGVRVDLDGAERVLQAAGVEAAVADGGDRLLVALPSDRDDDRARAVLAAHYPLGPVGIRVIRGEIPRTGNGKVDYPAIVAAAASSDAGRSARHPSGVVTPDAVARALADALGRPAGPEDSFAGLRGDSLSYVEAAARVERLLGHLPENWPHRTARQLAGASTSRASDREFGRRRGTQTETNVLLRAFAITSVVATHANLVTMLGGAHLLLVIAGFNFGRFRIGADRGTAVRGMLASILRIALPASLVIAVVSLWTPGLGLRQILLINQATNGDWAEPAWHYWFIEAILYTLIAVTVVLAIPRVYALALRRPFAFPFGLALAGLVTRYGVITLDGTDEIHRAHVIFWLFAIGWAASRADTHIERLLVSALVVGSIPGFFAGFERNAYVTLGALVLIWLPTLRVPRAVARVAGTLAAASLWIYLVHWQVYPWLEYRIPLAATVLSLLAGVVSWRLWRAFERRWLSAWARPSSPSDRDAASTPTTRRATTPSPPIPARGR